MDKSGLGLALHAKDACLITRLAFQSLPPMVSVVVGGKYPLLVGQSFVVSSPDSLRLVYVFLFRAWLVSVARTFHGEGGGILKMS